MSAAAQLSLKLSANGPGHHHVPALAPTRVSQGPAQPQPNAVSGPQANGSAFSHHPKCNRKLLGVALSDMKVEGAGEDDGVDLSYDSATSIKKENTNNNSNSTMQSVINRLKSNEGAYALQHEGGRTPHHATNDPPPRTQQSSQSSHQQFAPPGGAPGSPSSSRSGSGTPNNAQNTSAGGRLKFYKEGRVLLELTHRSLGDGEKVSWVPSGTKKVYWPPGPAPLSSRLDSNASTNTVTGSDVSCETGSHAGSGGHYSASPWGSPSPRLPSWQPSPPHRIKSTPCKLVNPSAELIFAMKPPHGVKNYREKKKKTFRRKGRQPESEIKIGALVLRLECQGSAGKVKLKSKRSVNLTIEQRCSRLETTIAKIITRKSQIHVPIAAWRVGRSDLVNLVKNPPSEPSSPVRKTAPASPARIYPASPVPKYLGVSHTPGGGMKVKSELKFVTEVSTSPANSPSTPVRTNKVKAETRTVSAETRQVPNLPITPTIGRIKSEDGSLPRSPGNISPGRLKMAALTSLMTPEMARVRMEIGPSPSSNHERDRDPSSFASPRKRFLKDYPGAPGPSPAKHPRLSTEHRLSTDSLGSAGDRASPYRPHDVKPFSSFSIDSIISSSAAAAAANSGSTSVSSPLTVASRIGSSSNAAAAARLAISGSGSPRHLSRGVSPPRMRESSYGAAATSHRNLDSPSKVHAPTPTRPKPEPNRHVNSPQPQSVPAAMAAAAAAQQQLQAAAAAAAAASGAGVGLPFTYPQQPLLGAAAAAGGIDPRLIQLAALQQQAALLQQQLHGSGVQLPPQLNPAALHHIHQQQQAAALQQHLAQGGLPNGFNPNPFGLYQAAAFNPYLAASAAGAAGYTPSIGSSVTTMPTSSSSVVWTPPVATPTPPNSNSSQRETPTPTRTLISPLANTTSALPTSSKAFSPPPPSSTASQDDLKPSDRADVSGAQNKVSIKSHTDAPLNLSMKQTHL